MQKYLNQPWTLLAVFTGFALLMRVFSFFPSVINHDESTYILIADALGRGRVYLKDVMDTKPIGIFLLFAFFQILFGKAIMVIRIITAVWVALTGFMLFLAHRQFLQPSSRSSYNEAPIASGIIYVFIASIYSTYGLSPNTELFFNLFTITALFLILRYKGAGIFFLAGLVLGAGFMIKYVVLFDALAIGLFYLWQQVTLRKSWHFWLLRCTLLGIGFIIPLLGVWIWYNHMGLGEIFWFYSFELSSRYVIKPIWYEYLNFVFNCFLSFLPVVIWFFYCLWNWRSTERYLPVLSSIWALFIMFIILWPGRMFTHYFVQFMVPLSLLAGSFFDPRRSPGPILSWMRKPAIGYPLFALLIGANVIAQKFIFFDRKDYPREVAAYLNTRLQPGDILYTGDYEQIIYHLTGTSSPTPYIHSSLIWLAANNNALKINQAEEFEKILNKNPRFILINYPLMKDNPLSATLQNSYTVVKTFDKEVIVYERNTQR
ncbi:MAG: glycosyltransferase family 39 protein [Saprospiraceae bacterium]